MKIPLLQKAKRLHEGFQIRNNTAILPSAMLFITTMRCQSRCKMCTIWKIKEHDDLTPEQLKKILANPFFNKIETVQFSGGEVFTRPDIGEVVRAFLNLPNITTIGFATNGLSPQLVNRRIEELIPELKKMDTVSVQISLHGVGKTHDAIMGIPGAFERVKETITLLRTLKKQLPKLQMTTNCVIQKTNVTHLAQLNAFTSTESLNMSYSPIIQSDKYYANDTSGALNPQERTTAIAFLRSISINDSSLLGYYHTMVAAMLEGKPRTFGCQFGRSLIMLEHNGNIHPCMNAEDITFGNILKEDIRDIWFSEKTQRSREELQKTHCTTCTASCGVNPYEYLKYALFRSPISSLNHYLNRWNAQQGIKL